MIDTQYEQVNISQITKVSMNEWFDELIDYIFLVQGGPVLTYVTSFKTALPLRHILQIKKLRWRQVSNLAKGIQVMKTSSFQLGRLTPESAPSLAPSLQKWMVHPQPTAPCLASLFFSSDINVII